MDFFLSQFMSVYILFQDTPPLDEADSRLILSASDLHRLVH